MMGLMVSPLRGADGNVEFLAHFLAGPSSRPGLDVETAIAGVVAAAPSGGVAPAGSGEAEA